MRFRRLLASGIWLATTVAATAMVWAVTSVVAADVTDRPPPVVARSEVELALRTGVVTTWPPDTAIPQATPPTPSSRSGGATTVPTAARPPTAPTPPAAPVAPPTTTTTIASAPAAPSTSTTVPVTVATTTPTTQPAVDPTATYATAGGVVSVACTSGYFIGLVAATPRDGYLAQILDRGPASVDVHFIAPGEEIRVRVVCFGGRPVRIPDQHRGDGGTSSTPST